MKVTSHQKLNKQKRKGVWVLKHNNQGHGQILGLKSWSACAEILGKYYRRKRRKYVNYRKKETEGNKVYKQTLWKTVKDVVDNHWE